MFSQRSQRCKERKGAFLAEDAEERRAQRIGSGCSRKERNGAKNAKGVFSRKTRRSGGRRGKDPDALAKNAKVQRTLRGEPTSPIGT